MSVWGEAGQFIVTAGGTAVALRFAGFRFRKEQPKPPRPICGCGDDFAMHDLRTGQCYAQAKKADGWTTGGSPNHWMYVACGCRHYTGPIPVDLEFRPPPLMPRDDSASG